MDKVFDLGHRTADTVTYQHMWVILIPSYLQELSPGAITRRNIPPLELMNGDWRPTSNGIDSHHRRSIQSSVHTCQDGERSTVSAVWSCAKLSPKCPQRNTSVKTPYCNTMSRHTLGSLCAVIVSHLKLAPYMFVVYQNAQCHSRNSMAVVSQQGCEITKKILLPKRLC